MADTVARVCHLRIRKPGPVMGTPATGSYGGCVLGIDAMQPIAGLK
jgi:hypothetical protein